MEWRDMSDGEFMRCELMVLFDRWREIGIKFEMPSMDPEPPEWAGRCEGPTCDAFCECERSEDRLLEKVESFRAWLPPLRGTAWEFAGATCGVREEGWLRALKRLRNPERLLS
jgi:hypothetical protein